MSHLDVGIYKLRLAGVRLLYTFERRQSNMYFKQALFLTIIAVLANTCYCSDERTEEELEEFRKFLLNLPNNVENEEKYPVIPGEISQLCTNCIGREKRTVMVRPKHSYKPWARLVQTEVRNKCPVGYRRLAFMCVPH